MARVSASVVLRTTGNVPTANDHHTIVKPAKDFAEHDSHGSEGINAQIPEIPMNQLGFSFLAMVIVFLTAASRCEHPLTIRWRCHLHLPSVFY